MLVLFAATSTVGLAELPDNTVNFDDPELPLEWGTVTVWLIRGAAALAFVAVLAHRLRRSRVFALLTGLAGLLSIGTTISTLRAVDDASLRNVTSLGAWFAFAGGALLPIAAAAQARAR